MKWPASSRAQTLGAVVAFLAMFAVGFVPLFGGPGYESAVFAGLLLPGLASICAALGALGRDNEPFDALARGATSGVVLAFVGYTATLAQGLRVGLCDPVGGSVTFVLGPGIGCALAGMWGALAGEVASWVPRRWLACWVAWILALAAPLAGIGLSLWRFYSTPIVFAFDPFFGFFSGSLYDTVVDATSQMLVYRAGSGLSALAAVILALHLGRDERGRLELRGLGRPGLALLGAACATGSLVLVLEGWRFGHWETRESISRELGAELQGKRCDVVYDRSLREEEVRLFARDCDQQIAAVERYFEAGDTGRVRAFLFASAGQKRRLMGAADTLIAKPWRREIYLQTAGYPHPVLAHELAHVVAGAFASGPFRVAGERSGVLPNPGLIEGAAVAAAPDDDVLLPSEWARAMLELDVLPKLDRVFAIKFLADNAAKSYAVAGSFVGFVHDRYGAAALKAWYHGARLTDVTHASLGALEVQWHEHISKLPLPEAAKATARARFDRPSIWHRRCPHEVDRCRKAGVEAFQRGDYAGAMRSYEDLLRFDPGDEGARLDIADSLLRRNERRDAVGVLSAVASDEAVSRIARNRALGRLADLDLEGGRLDLAAQRYSQLAARTLDEDALRTIEVKMGAMSDPRARRAVTALLIGSPERGVDPLKAGALLGAWIGEDPTDGLPEYLLGRDLVLRANYAEAAERFDRALAKRLAGGNVVREALRQRIIVSCALGDRVTARRMYEIWTEKGEPFAARRDELRRLVSRCTDVEIHAKAED